MLLVDIPPMTNIEPVPLPATAFDAAATILTAAFRDDPMVQYVMPDPATRARLLPWFLGATLRYGLRSGAVYTTSGAPRGVAIWLPPGKTSLTLGGMLRTGLLVAPLKLGRLGGARFLAMASATERLHKATAPGPHWYLWGLAVDPPWQRRGIGGALLRPVLDQAEAAGLPCYLETFNEASLPFYQAHRFAITATVELPNGGPPLWALLRPPASSIRR